MNELVRAEDFRQVLNNYQVSEDGKQLLQKVHLVLLAAATSSGRNAIIRELLKTGHYHYIVSDTTRKKRVNDGVPEQDGVEYWFRGEDEVLGDLRDGKYLEAAIIHSQQVSGISLRELETAESQHKVAITDIEIVGLDNIMKVKPDTIAIFVVPPNFEEWQKRLLARGQMHAHEYRNRLQSAIKEFDHALSKPYYRFVVNDNLADAVRAIDKLALGAPNDESKEQKNRAIVEHLRQATLQHLANL